MPPHSLCAPSCEPHSQPYLASSPSIQSAQSFSLHRPQDMKRMRNAKQLSLNVSPAPGPNHNSSSSSSSSSNNNNTSTKNTTLPLIIAPSTPLSTSFSSRRSFTPAPLSSASLTTVSESRRQSQLLLDDALPTPKLPLAAASTANGHRSISAYFSDYSLECGAASPYTSEPVRVLPNLYLGAEHNATDLRTLRRLGITFVLNVAIEIAQEEDSNAVETSRRTERVSGGVQYTSLPWAHHQKSLLRDFPTAFRLLDEAMSSHSGKGKALVHCQLGVSRSASLVIAYVMKSQQMGLTEAYDFVKQRSGVISPNMSLMYQLAEFEKTLKNPNWTPSDASSDCTSVRSRNSWCSQLDDDEPPYPFSAAFASSTSDAMSVPSSFTSARSAQSYMDIPSTPLRQEFCKRPLTPESAEDQPNTKPFQGAGRMAQPKSLLSSPPASRRNQYARTSLYQRSPLVASFTSASSYAPAAAVSGAMASLPLSPKTPTTARFSSLNLGLDLVNDEEDMVVPPTPLFQSSFTMPSLSSSSSSSSTSSSSSSASSVASFEVCSRPSICSTSSYFTACDDEDEFASVNESEMCSPRNSGTWSPSMSQPAMVMSMLASHREEEYLDHRLGGHGCAEEEAAAQMTKVTDTTVAVGKKTGGGSDYIFSPRPYTPTHPEARSFGEFYQALCMDGN